MIPRPNINGNMTHRPLLLHLIDYRAQADVVRGDISKLQQLKDSADDRIHMLELSFEELSGQTAVKDEELKTLTSQLAVTQNELMRSRESLEEMTCESADLYRKLDATSKERDALQDTCDKLRQELLTASETIPSKDKEIEELQLNLKQASARLACMNQCQEELRNQLRLSDDAKSTSQSQADFLEETLTATSKQLQANEDAFEKLR